MEKDEETAKQRRIE